MALEVANVPTVLIWQNPEAAALAENGCEW
jgi:hypothetical protein